MSGDQKYIYELFNLGERVAVVTGGMGRFGTEDAKILLKANARVAIFDIADEPNEELAGLAKDNLLRFYTVDVTKEEQVKEAVSKIEKEWDAPSILVNNAGWRASPNEVSRASVPFQEYPMDVWDEVFRINTTGAAICAKVVGGRLIERKKPGVIINIASHYALVSPDQRIYAYREAKGKGRFVKDASYSASKAALIAMTRDLATQWAPYGIRVVALAPGGAFNSKSDQEFVEQYNLRVPLGRMARVDEYNAAILFLASDASSYMTGSTLVMDGGWTAW